MRAPGCACKVNHTCRVLGDRPGKAVMLCTGCSWRQPSRGAWSAAICVSVPRAQRGGGTEARSGGCCISAGRQAGAQDQGAAPGRGRRGELCAARSIKENCQSSAVWPSMAALVWPPCLHALRWSALHLQALAAAAATASTADVQPSTGGDTQPAPALPAAQEPADQVTEQCLLTALQSWHPILQRCRGLAGDLSHSQCKAAAAPDCVL